MRISKIPRIFYFSPHVMRENPRALYKFAHIARYTPYNIYAIYAPQPPSLRPLLSITGHIHIM